MLENELLEFRQGRRKLGEDGDEILNDQYHENLMLTVRLRQTLSHSTVTVDYLMAQLRYSLSYGNIVVNSVLRLGNVMVDPIFKQGFHAYIALFE